MNMNGVQNGVHAGIDRHLSVDELLAIYIDPDTPEPQRLRAGMCLTERGEPLPELDFAGEEPDETIELPRQATSQGAPRSQRLSKSYDGSPDYDLPHNLAAECDLLSRMVFDHKFRARCVESLGREDFFIEPHRLLFDAFCSLHRADKPVDLANLNHELSPEARQQVTNELLSNILDAGELSLDEGHELIGIVAEDAALRRYIQGNRRLEREALARRLPPEQLACQARVIIESLSSPGLAPGWESPLLDGIEPPAPFPMDVLPGQLSDMGAYAKDALFVPPDYVLSPCLSIAGMAAGRSVALQISDDWYEFPALYSVIVGNPGTAKTPALKLVSRPIWRLFAKLMDDHSIELAQYEQDRRDHELARKKGDKTAVFDREVPTLRRIAASDATVESLARLLWENQRGFGLIHDELSLWLAAMNQYKSGEGYDKQFFLHCFSHSPIPVDRKGQNGIPMFIPEPVLGIAGGIQPDVLPSMDPGKGARKDGFIDRFLMSFPDELVRDYPEMAVPEDLRKAWASAVCRLWDRPMKREGGREVPRVVRFTADAADAFKAWYKAQCREMQSPHFNPDLKGAWSKLLTYGARLALVVEQLRWAYDERATNDRTWPVTLASVKAAIKLVAYYENHFRRVYVTIRGVHSENKLARDILDWIIKGERRTVRASDAKDNFRRSLKDQPADMLPDAFRWLVERYCLRRAAPTVQRRGRSSPEMYDVNPQFFEKRAPKSEGQS